MLPGLNSLHSSNCLHLILRCRYYSPTILQAWWLGMNPDLAHAFRPAWGTTGRLFSFSCLGLYASISILNLRNIYPSFSVFKDAWSLEHVIRVADLLRALWALVCHNALTALWGQSAVPHKYPCTMSHNGIWFLALSNQGSPLGFCHPIVSPRKMKERLKSFWRRASKE